MSNYSLNNIDRLYMHIDEHDYWDFHVRSDNMYNAACGFDDDISCTAADIDFSHESTFDSNGWIHSNSGETYQYACSTGLDLENIGLTGMDNGQILIRRDMLTNKEFYDIFSGSTYTLDADDLMLHMHPVSGSTREYVYPMEREDGFVRLNGGFWQGFVRSGDNYSILPTNFNRSKIWDLEFNLRRNSENEPVEGTTLNDTHPDNEGIFFYMGTRAENKWVYMYDSSMSGITCTPIEDLENCPVEEGDCGIFSLIEPDEKLENIDFSTDNGIGVGDFEPDVIETDNKFITYDRTCEGFNTLNDGGEGSSPKVMLTFSERMRQNLNLFLYMNHTCSGYTVNNIDKLYDNLEIKEYDSSYFYSDIAYNAFALRIKDDGSIGYRYMIKDCDSEHGISMKEGYSYPGIVSADEWHKISVTIVSDGGDKMKIYFKIDGKLKYITEWLHAFNFRELEELSEKQEGVPYSISLGGGTQGLLETILPTCTPHSDKPFPIKEYFAGTFIGDIKSFKFNAC